MKEEKKTGAVTGAVMVVGGGVGGMQASLDLANSGYKVYLVENNLAIGGVMAQLDKTFPTNDCAMCTMAPRLVEIGGNKDIEIITLADVEALSGEPGNFTLTLKKRPRFVKEDKCTGCGTCVENCPVRNEIYPDLKLDEVKLEGRDFSRAAAILERCGKKENLIAILQDIDAEYRYLPEFMLKYMAQKLETPYSRIYNLATFYTAFSLVPKGKYKVCACLGTACHVRGAPRIMESLEKELGIKCGETAKDMLFSLESVRCIGCCGLAPVFTINEDLYGKASPREIPRIIENYRKAEVNGKEYAKT